MMKTLTVLATVLTLLLALGIRPARAAGTVTTASYTLIPVRSAGVASAVQTATSPCTDPAATCLPKDKLIVIFENNAPADCTWTYTINWGDGASVTHTIGTVGSITDTHTYAPGEYHYELSGTGVSNIGPTNTCEPFDFKSLLQAPDLGGLIGGPITGAELLGHGSPSEPDIGCVCSVSGDPVNAFSGNLVESPTGLSIAGRGLAIDLGATYNSLVAGANSPVGFGWTMSYLFHLDLSTPNAVTLDEEEGSQITFTLAGGVYTAPPRVVATLTQNPDGTYTLVRDQRLTYTFSSTGQLTSEQDRNGYLTRLSYSGGQLSTITDPAGRTIAVTEQGSHITQLRDIAGGREIDLTYDAAGDLVQVTDAAGGAFGFGAFGSSTASTWQYSYDANHNLVQVIDPRGTITQNSYDGSHRVIRQVLDPAGLDRVTTWSYVANPDGSQTTTMVNPQGNQTIDTFTNGELSGLVTGAGTPSAATWSFAYDPATVGRTLTVDPNGEHWQATYDSHGNVLSRTDPLGRTSRYTYDAQNDLLTSTDPLGVTTTNSYDAHGNLLSISTPLTSTGQQQVTTYTYGDPSHPGDLTAVTDPDGKTTHYSYDADGNRISTTDPVGDETTASYNPIGWELTTVSPRGNVPGALPAQFTTSSTYTPVFGDVATTTDPLGHTTTNRYDADQNLISTTDPLGHTTGYRYDAAGEPTLITRPDGTTQATGYNPNGTVASQTDGLGHTTSYAYNPRAQLIATTDPLGRTTSQTVDGVGNVLALTDPSGQVTTNSYDGADELTGTSYSDGTTPNVSGITYDADGRLLGYSDGTGSSQRSYDSLGRLTSSTDGAGNVVRYGYDLKGQLTSLTYPNGQTVSQSFDAVGRLTGVTDWLGNHTSFGYDQNSDLTITAYPGSQVDTTIYDAADRITQMTETAPAAVHANFQYQRNADNLLTRAFGVPLGTASAAAPPVQSYAYTTLNQVCQAALAGGGCGYPPADGANYRYDAGDNLTGIGQNTLSYDAANELTGITTSSGPSSFSYDARGNRIAASSFSAPTATYSYDQANRLIRFSRGSVSASYRYDGTGLRMSKTVNGLPEAFVWDLDGSLPLLLQDGSTSELYGPGGSPFETINGSVASYLHHDQLGSVRLITSTSGAVLGSATYDAEGNRTASSGVSTPFGFAGAYTDAESGLLFLHTRYEDPATGQFLTRDPLDAVTREAYAYAGGDPVNATDPGGQDGALGGSTGIPEFLPPPPPEGGLIADGALGGAGGIPEVASSEPGDGLVASGGMGGSGGLPDVAPSEPGDGLVADGSFGGAGGLPDVAPSEPGDGLVADGGLGGSGSLPDLYPPPPPSPGLADATSPAIGPIAESGSLATGGAI